MREQSLSEVARAVGGRFTNGDVRVDSLVVDSREARPGALFVALRGSRTDGHTFVEEAAARGAAVMVREGIASSGPAVHVPDPGVALLALAGSERARHHATVVGITGSCGKTTTKDLTASVLQRRYRVHASPASFNNQIGVPLTILGARPDTEVVVTEIGGGVVGEIAELSGIARPSIGIVTNVGLAHVATFGSPERIAVAKAELVRSLPPAGVALLNMDDPIVQGFTPREEVATVGFGFGACAAVRATGLEIDGHGRARFILRAGGHAASVSLPIPGRHMVSNALAAAACGITLGVPLDECAEALGSARISPGRMDIRIRRDGVRVVHDAYNANPASMMAAIRALRDLRAGRRIAVLGAMAELGEHSEREHGRIGALVARLGIDRLIAVGEEATPVAHGALAAGMLKARVTAVPDVPRATALLDGHLRRGDVVLVKASRVEGLDRVVDALSALSLPTPAGPLAP